MFIRQISTKQAGRNHTGLLLQFYSSLSFQMHHDFSMPEAEYDSSEYALNLPSDPLKSPIFQHPGANECSSQTERSAQFTWDKAFNDLYSVAFESARLSLRGRFESDCEDVAMETLAEIISKNAEATPFRELKPLSAAIARNKSKDRLRKYLAAKRAGNLVQSLEHMKEAGPDYNVDIPQADFLDALTIMEVRDLLNELSQEVKKEYRLILKDHFFDHLSHSEIATKRKIAPSSVGKYLQRGISSMRGILERKPKLQKELRSILSDEHAIVVLLPLISAVQMLPYNLFSGFLCSAPIRRPASDTQNQDQLVSSPALSDEQTLLSAPDELPTARSLTLTQHTQLIERLQKNFSPSPLRNKLSPHS